MNYLAHLYLSEPHEEAWLGSLMGDFVKGPLVDVPWGMREFHLVDRDGNLLRIGHTLPD